MPSAARPRIWLWAFLLFIAAAVSLFFVVRSSDPAPISAPVATISTTPKSIVSNTDQAETQSAPALNLQTPTDESGVVAGTVWWFGTDAPAPEVPVFAEAVGAPILQTMSAVDGTFVFDGVLAGIQYTLRAYGADGGPYAFDDRQLQVGADELLENQNLTVWPGMTVPGVVYQVAPSIDVAGGAALSESDAERLFAGVNPITEVKRPYPGVRIRLTRLEPSTDPDLARADSPVQAVQANFDRVSSAPRREWDAVTDNAGRFAIPNVPSGRYSIVALTPPGVVAIPPDSKQTRNNFLIWPGRPGRELEFSFRVDGLSAEGRVVDTQTRPIEGALVRATPRAHDEGGTANTVGTVETITDANGQYRLDGLAAADVSAGLQYVVGGALRPQQAYTVTVVAEGFAPRQMEFPTLNAPLIEAARALVRIAERQNREGFDESQRRSALPKSHGRVIELPDLVLEASASIEGHVVDTAGRTIAHAGVSPYYALRPRYVPLESSPVNLEPFETDADGAFRMHSLAPGGYEFSVFDPETGTMEPPFGQPLRVQAGERLKNAKVVIPAAESRGAIRGFVIDARTKEPVEKFETKLGLRQSTPTERNPTWGNRSDEKMEPGHFLIQRLSPGQVDLRVEAEGYPAHWSNVEVRAGHETEVTIELSQGATVEGVVTRDGSPVLGAYVLARLVDKTLKQDEHGGSSDEHGAYRMENLAPAEYLISARYEVGPRVNIWQHATVRLKAGDIAHLDFPGMGGGRVVGTLTLPESFERGLVYVVSADHSGPLFVDGDFVAPPSSIIASAQPERGSSYAIDGIAPGAYTVVGVGVRPKIIPNGTTTRKDYVTVETRVTLSEGNSTRVDLEIP